MTVVAIAHSQTTPDQLVDWPVSEWTQGEVQATESALERSSVLWAVTDEQHASETAVQSQVGPRSSRQDGLDVERVLLVQGTVEQHYCTGTPGPVELQM